jgi:probable O-glycosylation ligase (exosortase A-associated)
MRDYLILGIILLGVPVSIARPFIGILLWCWVSYMNPHRLTWGIAYDFPAAMAIGAATLLGFLFTKDKSRLPMERETYLLICLWILFAGTTIFALSPVGAWDRLQQVSKILLMTFATMLLVNTRSKLRILLLTIVLSIGFFGSKGGLFSLRGGGEDRVYGPTGSFMEDNNDFALAVVMVLPSFFYLAREQTKKWFRILLRFVGAFSILSVIFTYSRGGFVGLASIAAFSLVKSRRKTLAVVLMAIAILAGSSFIPEEWFQRMETIGDVGDESAAGRINSWHFAWNLAMSRGIFGGGFDTFTEELFLRYAPDPYDFHAAHSIYFEMLGEHGFLGLTLFLGLLFSTLSTLQGLQRQFGPRSPSRWINDYAAMLQIGLVGYMTSGAFLGRAYFDLSYHLIAATIILKVLARKEALAQASEAGPLGAPVAAAV